jgi:RNA polymerase sigma-70 factor (ECF subfamily)
LPTKQDLSTGMPSDETLIARVARQDASAFEMLYDRHAAVVLGACLKLIGDRAVAERILQETFWQVWQGAGAYQPQKGSFTSWLFRIAWELVREARLTIE